MALAAIGVVIQGVALGHLPWISLVLAASFGAYGIVRKQVAADAQTGLFVECLLVGLPGLAYVLWLQAQGMGHFTSDPIAAAWLVACGPITALPLVLFSWSARRIPLSAMGFLQFISPTISFLIGLVEGEAFTPLRAVSFGFIWAGAGVYAFGAWTRSRALARLARESAETLAA
jgi:chloramphenicol-sensitive protein RarD